MYGKHVVWRLLGLAILTMAGHMLLPLAAASGQTAPADQPCLYFFTNDGCAPCRQVEPHIEALGREGYPVQTVNVSQAPQWAQVFQISSTPTVVLVKNNTPVGRHAGLIREDELKRWFSAIGFVPGTAAARTQNSQTESFAGNAQRAKSPSPAGGSRTVNNRRVDPLPGQSTRDTANPNFSSPTMLTGTAQPANAAESRAMAATVRLRVEDPQGISYATGTVIHSHNNESLVITCGHVFRDSAGRGKITAQYDFYAQPKTAVGQLISYDADARDVALVVIQTPTAIQPVAIASPENQVRVDHDVFSLGCDEGRDPTIRHSRIKNRANYDGSPKYDIFGRPVIGRSGGGLFNANGELIGVCNAAAVEVDEGIYTALETLHWQLASSNLDHLFVPATYTQVDLAQGRSGSSNDPDGNLDLDHPETYDGSNGTNLMVFPIRPKPVPMDQLGRIERTTDPGSRSDAVNGNSRNSDLPRNRQTLNQLASHEVVIIIRSNTDPNQTEAITIDNPTPQLIEYLQRIQIRR